MDPAKKKATIYAALEILRQCEDENDAIIASIENSEDVMALCASLQETADEDTPEGVSPVKSSNWFRDYAMSPAFHWSPAWRAAFRIPFAVFRRVSERLAEELTRSKTRFKDPIPGDLKLGAFLMYIGGNSNATVAKQLGLGTSTVCLIIKEVANLMCASFGHAVSFPDNNQDVVKIMQGFEGIAGLPHCAGAIGSTHVRWSACPEFKQELYGTRMDFPSVVLFAVATADGKFTFADVGRPGGEQDQTIFEQSALKTKLENREWLGDNIASLPMQNLVVRPYFVGSRSFPSTECIVKPEPVMSAEWNDKVTATHRPISLAFNVLKNRFKVLKSGLLLQREGDVSLVLLACVLLHNMCLEDGDSGEDFSTPLEEEAVSRDLIVQTALGKQVRDALAGYLAARTYM